MNEHDKQELLQQLDKCKGTLDVITTFGDNRFCGFNCMLDCQSCYKGAVSTLDMIITMVKEKNVMDAATFLKERNRMCKTNPSCYGCPAHTLGASNSCKFAMENWTSFEQQINLVKEWAEQHPRKTRQSVFLKQWPEVSLDGNQVISVSPCEVSKEYRDMDCDKIDCAECRKEFWMKEVE